MGIKHNKNIKITREYVNILGIKIASSSTSSLLTAIEEKISRSIKFSILTPNPELVLMAQKNKELKETLNSADYSIPDGIGLAQAARFLSLPVPKNKIFRFFVTIYQGALVGAATVFDQKWLTEKIKPIKGRVLFEELIKLSTKKHWKVFLLGGMGDEAEIASQKLQITNPKLHIQFDKFVQLDKFAQPVLQANTKIQSEVVKRINKIKPDLLFVAFGNPKQEIWIHENLSKLKIGGAMAVGGTFRYVAGLSTLPPKWMENWGLEWLWRLITEPNRIKRVFNAFPIFPLKVFWYKVTHF